jgi:hypothetical protein
MGNRDDNMGIYGRWADRDNADRFHGPQGRHYYAPTYANMNEPYEPNHVVGISGMNGPQNQYGFERGYYDIIPQYPHNDPYNDAFFEPVYRRRERAGHPGENLPIPRQQPPMPVLAHHPALGQPHNPQEHQSGQNQYPRNWHGEPQPNPAYNSDGFYRGGRHGNEAQMPPRYQRPWPRQQEPYKMNGPYRGTPDFNPRQRPNPNEQPFGFNPPDRHQGWRLQEPPRHER